MISNRTWRLPALGLMLLLASAGWAQKTASLVFTHVTVIDGNGRAEQPDMTVVIRGERISAVGRTGKIQVPDGANVVEAGGKFLIPGLWDMHVHLMGSRDLLMPMLVANGITGVRDMGIPFSQLEQVHQWRDEIAAGKLLGPRIFSPGPILTGALPPRPVWPGSIAVADAADARAAIARLLSARADFVKVHNFVPRAAYFAIAEEARKQHLVFAGHTPDAISALEASDHHQKSIEHLTGILLACSSDEAQLRQELMAGTLHSDASAAVHVRRQIDVKSVETYDEGKAATLLKHFVRNGTWQVPTLVFLRDSETAGGDNEEKELEKYIPRNMREAVRVFKQNMGKQLTAADISGGKTVFQKQLALVRAMNQAGVKLLAGTDLVLYPGFALHSELELLVQAGLTPMAALQTATRNPAEYFGLQKSLGTVERGKLADLVLLNADPLKDIRNTRQIFAVVLNGRLVSRATLEGLLAKAEAAANQ